MPANEHALLGCPGTGKVAEGRTPANLATGPPVPREMEKNCECHYQIAIVCNCCRKGENPTKGHLRSPRPMLINLPTILLPVRALSVSFYGPLNQDLDDDCRSMSLMMRGGGGCTVVEQVTLNNGRKTKSYALPSPLKQRPLPFPHYPADDPDKDLPKRD